MYSSIGISWDLINKAIIDDVTAGAPVRACAPADHRSRNTALALAAITSFPLSSLGLRLEIRSWNERETLPSTFYW